jgi:ribonuclease P protein component
MLEQLPSSQGYSLPRSARLLDAAAFARVFAAPTRSADSYFTVLARPRAQAADGDCSDAGARLGLAISKRCAARAVVRNRIKRVIRESFRHVRCDLSAVDVVVSCRRAAVSADNGSLYRALSTHWKRIDP